MPAKSSSPLLLIVLLIALLVVPTTAAAEMIDEAVDGDKHIITIYDELPVTERVFDTPGYPLYPFPYDVWIQSIREFTVHRDIGDLDSIVFASNEIVPNNGYTWVDQVPITVYWVSGGQYLGSGTTHRGGYDVHQHR